MAYVLGLRCRECGADCAQEPTHVCDQCFGPLEVRYDYAAMRGALTREAIAARPRGLWRYRELLPLRDEPTVGPHAGGTPLVRADRLAAALGVRELYVKDDSVSHPSFSYKDRVVSVAIAKAIELGFDTVACASTGNLANSVSAHAARAGLRCFLFLPDRLEQGKIIGSAIYGPHAVAVRGTYDDVNRLCSEIADKYRWAFVNINMRPFYTEGAKTYGFEIAEDLGWAAPRHVVVPTAGGTLLPRIARAFAELRDLGLIDAPPPAIHCAQAAGCAPIVHALHRGHDTIEPVKPDTIATSIAIGNPGDGYDVLEAVRTSGGWAEAATDAEIVDAIHLLARTEGIFTEPAGGATVAVTRKLVEQGRIRRDESIVIGITGNGYKTIEAVRESVATPFVINARLPEFDHLYDALAPRARHAAGRE
ncbi:MAG: threonine synthase [Candidatus Binatia bacterium]